MKAKELKKKEKESTTPNNITTWQELARIRATIM